MEVCKAYKEHRRRWKVRYAELERACADAEKNEQWDLADRLGDSLAEMEQNSGYKRCFSCKKKGCPAWFDGFE